MIIKTFEELREHLWQAKQDTMEFLVDRLGELTPFEQGRYAGEIRGYDEVINVLRDSMKYGDVE